MSEELVNVLNLSDDSLKGDIETRKVIDEATEELTDDEASTGDLAPFSEAVGSGGMTAMSESCLSKSVIALRIAVLATACSQTIIQPNFPFLVIAGDHPDAFPDTSPFGFASALYFLPLTTFLGSAIASTYVGQLSDRVGRRPCVLTCVGLMACTVIGQYFARRTYWGFCAASFVNGLFCSCLPVAMAYASDIHPNRSKKDEEIGVLVGFNMMGMACGGIVAILMEDLDLFSPLLVASAFDFLAFGLCFIYLLENSPSLYFHEDNVDEEEGDLPKKMDWMVFGNVIGGALLDNFGSCGLFSLTLAPLAFNTYLRDLEIAGEAPIMSPTVYKLLSVGTGVMVIPGAALAPPVFARVGAAGGCVAGNAITAAGIALCWLVATIPDPPSPGSFAAFVVCLYMIFPLTVLSQLSTGPMLDRLAPPAQRGWVQGMNMTVTNFAFAMSPWLLGLMSDSVGISATLWFCVALSLFAALVNTPLMFTPGLQQQQQQQQRRWQQQRQQQRRWQQQQTQKHSTKSISSQPHEHVLQSVA